MNKIIDVVAAIIVRDGWILIGKRKQGRLEGFWEFPGGGVEDKESLEESLKREIKEELGVLIKVGLPFHSVVHKYEWATIKLHSFFCEIIEGVPMMSNSHSELNWVSLGELLKYDLALADIPIARLLAS